MDATKYKWIDIEEDNPIPHLTRRKLQGEKMLVAQVTMAKGCHVASHHHESEQIAVMLSGSTIWTIGAEGSLDRKTIPMIDGDIMVIPSNVWHSVDVLEDTVVVDILSPIGPMGVDSQKS